MKKEISAIIKKIHLNRRGRPTAFVIGNTSGVFPQGRLYPTPLRHTGTLIYGGIVARDVETAVKVARLVDGKVDYIFVDSEKKIEKIYYGRKDVGNMERHVRQEIKRSKILTYKGNDLAVEAVDFLLGQIVGDIGARQIAVIGLGNIGAKVALKLVERGAYVRAYRRDKKKLRTIVSALNLIKSEHTISPVREAGSIAEACRGASIIIATADSRAIITDSHLKELDMSGAPVLVDVGKGCFAGSVTKGNYPIYRVDISMVQKHIFSGLKETSSHYGKALGRRTIPNHGIKLVSLGLLGKEGEIVVDDINKPKMILGVADGRGNFLKRSGMYAKALKKLKSIYSIR